MQTNPNFRSSTRSGGRAQQRVVTDPVRGGVAAKYFLSDAPGATVPASRLSTVLANLDQGKGLSAIALDFLREEGYFALLGLAKGESAYDDFAKAAGVECEMREAAAA